MSRSRSGWSSAATTSDREAGSSSSNRASQGVELVAVAPTVLLPELTPYLESGQLRALLATPRDGAAYRESVAPTPSARSAARPRWRCSSGCSLRWPCSASRSSRVSATRSDPLVGVSRRERPLRRRADRPACDVGRRAGHARRARWHARRAALLRVVAAPPGRVGDGLPRPPCHHRGHRAPARRAARRRSGRAAGAGGRPWPRRRHGGHALAPAHLRSRAAVDRHRGAGCIRARRRHRRNPPPAARGRRRPDGTRPGRDRGECGRGRRDRASSSSGFSTGRRAAASSVPPRPVGAG